MVAKRTLLLLVAVACCVAAALAVFDATDMHALHRISDYVVTNDGAVFVQAEYDPVKDSSWSALHYYSPRGTRQLTKTGSVSGPAMHAEDGETVFFFSTMASTKGSQLFYMSLGGNDTTVQLTSYPISFGNVIMTPNYFIFSAEVWDDCGANFSCTAERNAALAKNPNRGIVFDKLFVRHWDKLVLPGKSSQLFTQAIKRDAAQGTYELVGTPHQITAGLPQMNVPVPPFGGKEQLSVNHNYSRIAFTAALIDRTQAWSTGWVIYEAEVNPSNGAVLASVPPVCLTCARFAGIRTTNPAYDPSGRYLAFLAMERPGYESDRLHLELHSVGSTAPSTPVAFLWDRSISEYAWSPIGTIFAGVDEAGERRIYAIDVRSGAVAPFVMNGTNVNIQVDQKNRMFYIHSSFNEPTDLYYANPSLVRATKINPEFPTASFDEGVKFIFRATNGNDVQSWFLRPGNWTPGVKFPLVVLIHGGPQGAWNSRWSNGWNPQLYTQRGYAVIMINVHGSTGFGQRFTDAVRADWGGQPFRDILSGVRGILRAFPWLDEERIGAAGASYGGYMINWIAGNAPDMFGALVMHDGRYDLRAISYGATDELWFPEWEFKGLPWENPVGYAEWSPARHASKWKTPMLIIQGEKDYRVDVSHGLATFTTCQRQNIPSRLLYFPTENHWVLRPHNNIQWYREVLNWFDEHVMNRDSARKQ